MDVPSTEKLNSNSEPKELVQDLNRTPNMPPKPAVEPSAPLPKEKAAHRNGSLLHRVFHPNSDKAPKKHNSFSGTAHLDRASSGSSGSDSDPDSSSQTQRPARRSDELCQGSTAPNTDADSLASRSFSRHSSGSDEFAPRSPNLNGFLSSQLLAPPVDNNSTHSKANSVLANKGSRPSSPIPQFRFETFDDSTHVHYLDLHATSKLKSHQIMNIFGQGKHHIHLPHLFGDKDKEKEEKRGKKENASANAISAATNPASHPLRRSNSDASLTEKYGKVQETIGKGAFGVVRVAHKVDPNVPVTGERLYAVKEFRKRSHETSKTYIKRLTSEFCISSTLSHTNIIQTLDLLPTSDNASTYCEVMQYCAGGDLYGLISSSGGGLDPLEVSCFFKQMVNGVEYLHRMGVAHRDLKPENLLLTSDGCLKITDFGNSECFRMAWENEKAGVHASKGVCGSEPYIAPEEFGDKEFDPRLVDVWSIGIIYLAMLTGKYLWNVARPGKDAHFDEYVEARNKMRERENKVVDSTSSVLGSGIEVIEKLEP
ncbi:kinase-like protein, partial [Jimgerdemannia flammicorona]